MIWAGVFIGDRGRKAEPLSRALSSRYPCLLCLSDAMPTINKIASNPPHVKAEICPLNARQVTNKEVMIDPKAAEKMNDSAESEKFRFQILRVKTLPAPQKPTAIRKNRPISILGNVEKV